MEPYCKVLLLYFIKCNIYIYFRYSLVYNILYFYILYTLYLVKYYFIMLFILTGVIPVTVVNFVNYIS